MQTTLKEKPQGEKWTAEKVLEILAIANMTDITSLDKKISDEDGDNSHDSYIGDFIPSNEPTPQEIIENESTRKFLIQLMRDNLKPREYQVMMLRYGFEDGVRLTLEEIGDLYEVTRERIRQLEHKALKKLKWVVRCKYKLKREDL